MRSSPQVSAFAGAGFPAGLQGEADQFAYLPQILVLSAFIRSFVAVHDVRHPPFCVRLLKYWSCPQDGYLEIPAC